MAGRQREMNRIDEIIYKETQKATYKVQNLLKLVFSMHIIIKMEVVIW